MRWLGSSVDSIKMRSFFLKPSRPSEIELSATYVKKRRDPGVEQPGSLPLKEGNGFRCFHRTAEADVSRGHVIHLPFTSTEL